MPYEPVEDSMWRRGRALADNYPNTLAKKRQLAATDVGGIHPQPDRIALADTPARRHAADY
ncbi:hypothetical protein [Streptomyces sp. NPDC058385]|uniref:hypothetical protein n=1 Tax=Streptomyces sp. NPDC058385 TaxID=3346473 RepID=UPI0036619544